MNIEEKAKDALMQTWLLPSKCEKLAPIVADFASEAVKAREKEIADDLEALSNIDGVSIKRLNRYADRLRGEK